MRFLRPRRRAAACRPVSFLSLIVSTAAVVLMTWTVPSRVSAAELSGTVVDENDAPIARAAVRATDASGRELASTFTNDAGRFSLDAGTACRIDASLAGFTPASASCASEPLRLVLRVAPVEEHVLVSATRTNAPASQVGASTTVFTADDLEARQTPLVATLLEGTPGAMVVRSGAPGTLTSVFVRGGESDYNKVLLDGVPLNEPGGSFYLNNLTTENLERVEIVRGAYSSLFGTDAMASVIQLFTRRADGAARRPHGQAFVEGGSYGTLRGSASVAGAAGRVDYSIGAAGLDTDNRVPNSALRNTTFSGNVGVALSATATLRAIGRTERERVGTPGPTAFGRPDLSESFDRHDAIGSVSFDQRLNDQVRQRASYSLAASDQHSLDGTLDPSYVATFNGQTASFPSTDFYADAQTRLRRHHAEYQADLRLSSVAHGDHLLTLLGDWDGERAAADDTIFVSHTENARDNFGIAAQDQFLWRRLSATAGGRIERNESFGTAAVPRGSVVYTARQSAGAFGDTRIRASAGLGIKEPTMLESFSTSPYFRGNPDLEPERARTAEVGIDQRFAADRAKVEVTWFDNRYRNIISLRTINPATFEARYENVGLTRARGLELGAQAAPWRALQLRGGYTLLDSKILESVTPDDEVFGIGNEAFRRPRHSGFVGAAVAWNRLTADVNGVLIGSFVDSDFGLFFPPLTRNSGYTTWNARASLAVTRQISATLAVDNLTDRDYSVPFGYQPLLRAVRAGVRVGF